jgi:hypothetical protein
MKSFWRKSLRPVLIATLICTSPALLLLVLAIINSFLPEEPTGLQPSGGFYMADDGPSWVLIALVFSTLLALASFSVSTLVAFTWHKFAQARKLNEMRQLEERFGCKPPA